MLARIRNTFLAIVVASTGIVPADAAGLSGEYGKYLFRYKAPEMSYTPPAEPEAKEVSAYFVGAVGQEFDELLPLKPEWQDDTWRVASGYMLPDGIAFDAGTRAFTGTPTRDIKKRVVMMEGIDARGNFVAEAKVTFDIHAIIGKYVKVDLYAHTGRYKVDELPIPDGVTVDEWDIRSPPPPGITAAGPYFEGVPTAAGKSEIFIYAKDYLDNIVATFSGTYLVEDGPTFNFLADNVRPLPYNSGYVRFVISSPGTFTVNRLIDPSKPARLALEIDPDDGLPAGVVQTKQEARSLRLEGDVRVPYETGRIRIKATDSDGAVGYSNWHRFGTSHPLLGCLPTGTGIPVYTGKELDTEVPAPRGSGHGVPTFTMVSGNLPTGLKLADGRIVGIPTVSGEKTSAALDIAVDVDGVINNTTCTLNFNVLPGNLSLSDSTPPQDQHVRVGSTYRGTAKVDGGQSTFTVSITDPDTVFSFSTPNVDTDLVGVTGTVADSGPLSIGLSLANGDGNVVPSELTVIGYDALSIGAIPTVEVKRLAAPQVWATLPVDYATVIPDLSGAVEYPLIELSSEPDLPAGLSLEDDKLTGATSAPPGSYGMQTVKLTDFEQEPVFSQPFEIVVLDRDEIAARPPVPPTFTVEWDVEQTASPVVFDQPPGAANFEVEYSLDGPALPDWLTFDETSGAFTASAEIPYSQLGEHGPYTITATDEEKSTDTSTEFMITVADWPAPAAKVVHSWKGTVSGKTSDGETPTWINIPGSVATSLRDYVDEQTVIGGRAGLKFLGSTPDSPAGLAFDKDNGTFSGRPTSEFNGTVTVHYEDARSRAGSMDIPLEVKPYPSVKVEQGEYLLPRLTRAQTLEVPVRGVPLGGFWTTPVWSLDTTKGPALPVDASDTDPLSVDPVSGMVKGFTRAASGTRVDGLVLKATSAGPNGEKLESWTAPFSIVIGDPVPMTIAYDRSDLTYYLVRDEQGALVPSLANPTTSPYATVGGSYIEPLSFSVDLSDAIAAGLTGSLGVNPDNGNIVGSPDRLSYPNQPRPWTVKVTATDSEGRKTADPATLEIFATLDGFVGHDAEPIDRFLRQDERFSTPGINVTNHVGPVVFSTSPAALPQGVDFSGATGSFDLPSAFAEPSEGLEISVSAADRDTRGFAEDIKYKFTVKPPLSASLVTPITEPVAVEQYGRIGDGGIDLRFDTKVENHIGGIRYSLEGELPGQLVNRIYDDQENFLGWRWTDEDGNVDSLPATVSDEDAWTQIPLDALVFDTLRPSLAGRPSGTGEYHDLKVVANDLHANAYEDPASPNRVAYNRAETEPFSISVSGIRALSFPEGTGGDSSAKLYSASSPVSVEFPAASPSVMDVRYSVEGDLPGVFATAVYSGGEITGYDVGGTIVPRGMLPPDAMVIDPLARTLKGSPSREGTFTFRIKAEDKFQRTGGAAYTETYSVIVGPADALAVANNVDIETLHQYTSQPTLRTVVSNAAYGLPVTWTAVLGELPEGVSPVKGTSLSYSGYPEETGSFGGIVWKARDAAGREVQSEPATFVVEDRIPFELEGTGVLGMVAGNDAPAYVISALNTAYGLPVDDGNWTLPAPGTLPEGIELTIENGTVRMSGSTDVAGEYPVKIAARDSLGGAQGTDEIEFVLSVLDESETIELAVTPAVRNTKIDVPVTARASADSRTFGELVWLSETPGVTVDKDGNITASFPSAGTKKATVSVTDGTGRESAVELSVEVMPRLKLSYPSMVYVDRKKSPGIGYDTQENVFGTVTYAKSGGNWPDGIDIDPQTGNIIGLATADRGKYSWLRVEATDTFTVDGVTYTEKASSNPSTTLWIDGDDNGFALETSVDPDPRVVWVANNEGEPLVVSAINFGWDLEIPAADWTVSGGENLPPGIVPTVAKGKVTFSGVATQTGTFTGVRVSATDGLGQTKHRDLVFNIIPPGMEIDLRVQNVTTKAGVGFSMTPTVVANTAYGKLNFYSYDIDGDLQTQVPGEFSSAMDIDRSTGTVTGVFGEVGDYDYDVYVTDATKRVVSKPAKVSVMPNVRMTVPQQVIADQGMALNRTTATDYSLGTLIYERGSGNWPDGFDVNPANGTVIAATPDPITGAKTNIVTSGADSYSGLTVKVTDTFSVGGKTFVDVQESNAFTITVNPIDALPIISTPSKKVLGTRGTAIRSWRPSVIDDLYNKAWNYAGTKYSLSHDVTQYGLAFDENTGVISGTAHTAFIVRDMTVTVTSVRGDESSTLPFWIGVAPDGPMVPVAGQDTSYKARYGVSFTTKTPVFENYIGNIVRYEIARPSMLYSDTRTGLIYGTPSTGEGVHPAKVRMVDEFNRTSEYLEMTITIEDIDMTATHDSFAVFAGQAYTSSPPVLADVRPAGDSFRLVGDLPAGLVMDPDTGIISGTSTATPGVYPLTLVHEDDYSKKETSFKISVIDPNGTGDGYKYWRIQWMTSTHYPKEVRELVLRDAAGANVTPLRTTFTPWNRGNLLDGDVMTYVQMLSESKRTDLVTFTFPVPVTIREFSAIASGGFKTSATYYIERSHDRVSWVQVGAVSGNCGYECSEIDTYTAKW